MDNFDRTVRTHTHTPITLCDISTCTASHAEIYGHQRMPPSCTRVPVCLYTADAVIPRAFISPRSKFVPQRYAVADFCSACISAPASQRSHSMRTLDRSHMQLANVCQCVHQSLSSYHCQRSRTSVRACGQIKAMESDYKDYIVTQTSRGGFIGRNALDRIQQFAVY